MWFFRMNSWVKLKKSMMIMMSEWRGKKTKAIEAPKDQMVIGDG